MFIIGTLVPFKLKDEDEGQCADLLELFVSLYKADVLLVRSFEKIYWPVLVAFFCPSCAGGFFCFQKKNMIGGVGYNMAKLIKSCSVSIAALLQNYRETNKQTLEDRCISSN